MNLASCHTLSKNIFDATNTGYAVNFAFKINRLPDSNMNQSLEQAFEIIEDFFVANQIEDPLLGMEVMVAHYKQLTKTEQVALATFMDASRKKTV
jgi:hypothetical protein